MSRSKPTKLVSDAYFYSRIRRKKGGRERGKLTLEAIIGSYLVHHLLVILVGEAVGATRMKEMMGDAIASI